jgi:hypothetical protein
MAYTYTIIETPKIKKEYVSVINDKIEKIYEKVKKDKKMGLRKIFLVTTEDYLHSHFLNQPSFLKFDDDGNIHIKNSTVDTTIGGMKKFANWIAPYAEDGKLLFTNYHSIKYYFIFKDGRVSDLVHPDPTGIPIWKLERE